MANVLIVAYLLIVLAMVTVILLQRSEGGGLGMGGGANSFMSVRGTANVLTRSTAILAALFFAAAIGLTLLNGADRTTQNILDNAASTTNKPTSVLDALNAAQKDSGTTAPATTPAPAATPATTAPANQDAPNVALPAANDNKASTSSTSSGTTSTTTSGSTSTAAPAASSSTSTTPASSGTTSSGTSSGASSTTTPATGTETPASK